jgi:hypothetical protein
MDPYDLDNYDAFLAYARGLQMGNESSCPPKYPMGLQMGLNMGFDGTKFKLCKRKFRWLMRIDGLCDTAGSNSINILPPLKSARPSLTFKEMEVRHLNEHVYYPMKPEWKSINLVLYDVKRSTHPVWNWIIKCYDPKSGSWFPCIKPDDVENQFIKPDATLNLYDGCGHIIEKWQFENIWPQVNEFGELDMGNMEYVTCDLTLRYARAWIDYDIGTC